jgi:transposase
MKTFRPYQPDQLLLLPPSIEEWLPEHHLARFVSEVVDELDLSAIENTYSEERGYPPYHPRMMTKILVYGYCTGTYSSRRLAEKLVDSVAYRYLAAGNQPDFRTLSDFRKLHGVALSGLFEQILKLCHKSGLVKLGRVAIDGTKIKANASKHKAMSYGRMNEKEAQLKREVRAIMERAEAIDREEDELYGVDRSGNELPAELARREDRLKKIREAKAELEAEARAEAAQQAAATAARIAEREREERRRGRRFAGAKPKPVDAEQAKPSPKAQLNFTDPQSRVQKTGDGYIQGYNAQIAVDAHAQVIVAQHVTASSPDVGQLKPAIAAIRRVLRRKPKQLLADAGYWSEANVVHLERQKIEAFVATGRMKHGAIAPSAPRGRPPAGLSIKERMQRKLRTKRGHKIYSRRKVIAEPPFGQIKQARGFRQFLRRGVDRVRQEWALVCTAHNLLKLHRAWAGR